MGWYIVQMMVLLGLCLGTASAQLAWNDQEFMDIREIKAGMVGYGKTVFEGTRIDTFDVEVIGVLNKIDFGFDMILIKVTSGPLVERKYQTISGMSGSPIYIEDRLIGAYAFGWNFQQEAIAGVTPIAAMLDSAQPGAAVPRLTGSLVPQDRVLRVGDRVITRVRVAPTESEAQRLQAQADPTTMVLCPVATPLFVSGMAEQSLPALQKLFSRYNVRALPGPGQVDGPAPALEPGSSAAVSLMEGDANLSAVGTVTYVKGDTVLAFGHPFFGMGAIDFPMSTAYVHGVVSSSLSSFKLASPMGRVGAFTSDRTHAVAGTLNRESATLPVTLFLNDDAREFTRRYRVDMIRHADITPVLFYLYVVYNGASQMGDLFLDEGTFDARMLLSTDKLGDLDQRLVISPQASPMFLPLGEFYLLTDLLMTNRFEPVAINSIFIDLKYQPGRNTAFVEKVTADRPIARPGETVNLTVRIRPFGKPVETLTIPVKVPDHATEPVMMAAVVGGAHGMLLKPLTTPTPTPEEGIRGIVRWLTEETSSQSLIAARLLPTPSYGYRGAMMRDLPQPIFDLLRSADTGVLPQGVPSEGRERQQGMPTAAFSPTVYTQAQPMPYVTGGVQTVVIAIDSEERSVQPRRAGIDFGTQLPVLSTSLTPGRENEPGRPSGDTEEERLGALVPWLTPQQQARYALLRESMALPRTAAPPAMTLPTLTLPTTGLAPRLSQMLSGTPRAQHADVDATPAAGGPDGEAALLFEDDEEEEEKAEAGEAEKPTTSVSRSDALLTRTPKSWGLTERKDFLRGKHLGTGVTSQGNLLLVPAVRSIYQTTDMVPAKMVATANGTYVAGWGSINLVRIGADGRASDITITPAMSAAKSITALAADAAGNLLIATWPDQRVRLLGADGAVRREWALPGAMIWDLAVATDGKRYAAGDMGMLYQLQDDQTVPTRVACTVPDKHVFTLATGTAGEVYLATMPRGKIYRLESNGRLTAVHESLGSVTSLTLDGKGNLYAGLSPNCRVVRIAPDGAQHEVMRGMGRGNAHVLALRMVGNELYAATGPAGGIYRIIRPDRPDSEALPIFARQDLRNGGDERDGVGPESVMVNALVVTPAGEVLAAASTPAQVLKLEPRTQGAFLSTVLNTPITTQWGNLELHGDINANQSVTVESRSGNTAVPDQTWSPWAPVDRAQWALKSPAATYMQFRLTLAGTPQSPSVAYLRMYYHPSNQAPVVRIQQPKAGDFWNGTRDIRWEGTDPDGDQLVYTVFTSRDNGRTWQQLVRNSAKTEEKAENGEAPPTTAPRWSDAEIAETRIPWDTKSTPDGNYRIRVVATDKYARPTNALSGEAISPVITIDNTPPTISLEDRVYGWDAAKRFIVSDNLTPIVGGRYRIDEGPWTALVPEDGLFNSREEAVRLLAPTGEITLIKGEFKLAIQVVDRAGNVLDRTITVLSGQQPPRPETTLPVPQVGAGVDPADLGLADFILRGLQ